MKQDSTINETQALIMRQLFDNGALRFSQINTKNISSDQFSYHLRQLAKNGLIEKTSDNRYQLSVAGRGRAILMDNHSSKFIEQGFTACRVVLTRGEGASKQYLIQRRTRVPYKGYHGDPGGKILFGEDVLEAAARNMKAETGLTCDMSIAGLVHFKDSYQDEVVQDKFFFVIKATNPSGELLAHGITGDNMWMTYEEILANAKVHQGFTDLIEIAEGSGFQFVERTNFVDEY